MNKANILTVTPNISGNIGSCTIQSNEVTTGNSFWTSQRQVTQVNSCTGQVVSINQYTDYTGLQFIGTVGIVLFVSAVLVVLDLRYL